MNWPEGSSRSSVNNSTSSPSGRLNTGIKSLLKRRGIHLDDHMINVMEQGAQIRVDKDHIMKLKLGYYVDNGSDKKYHPPELVDVRPEYTEVWDGWETTDSKVDNTADFVPGWESWDWG